MYGWVESMWQGFYSSTIYLQNQLFDNYPLEGAVISCVKAQVKFGDLGRLVGYLFHG